LNSGVCCYTTASSPSTSSPIAWRLLEAAPQAVALARNKPPDELAACVNAAAIFDSPARPLGALPNGSKKNYSVSLFGISSSMGRLPYCVRSIPNASRGKTT
jgi:hypothetical protein